MKSEKRALSESRCLNLFLIGCFALVLVLSVFLPIFSSLGEANQTQAQEVKSEELEEELQKAVDQEPGLNGWVSDVKRIEPADIWHEDVPDEDYDKGPFNTDTATVHLELTGKGESVHGLEPFDWVFSIDSSGSMQSNDPQRFRVSGAQLFVDRVEENYSDKPPAKRAKGSLIDFDGEAKKIRGLTDNYPRLRTDLEDIDQRGGTNFNAPMGEALNEFSLNGRGDDGNDEANWYHLFLTDGIPSPDYPDWRDLADTHGDRNIPIFAIGLGDADEGLLEDMAERSGGDYYYVEQAEDLHDVFADIFEEVSTTSEVAAESPPEEPMIREVLPPHLEYVEDSVDIETTPSMKLDVELTIEEDDRKTILKFEPKREGKKLLNIHDEIHIQYDVRAKRFSHDLPITAYDGEFPASRVEYYNRTSEDIDTIYTEGPGLNVHGIPDPVVGASQWEGVSVGEPVTFMNRTDDEVTTWPGDCKPRNYTWKAEGEEYKGSGEDGEAGEEHRFTSAGTHNVEMTAVTDCGVKVPVTKAISVAAAPPPPPPPPPPSPPAPPGMGIANPTVTPVQVGVGNPMATPTPTGVPQPTAMPQVSMQPVATSQPVGMPTTTAIFAGTMPVAAQKNPAEKIKMSVKNLN